MTLDEEGSAAWPDQTEVVFWQNVLDVEARTQLEERGVTVTLWLTVGYGYLWANWGTGRRERVAGRYVEITGERLHHEIDFWVAFERPEGAGVFLDRDLAYIELWNEGIPEERRIWSEAAALLTQDVNTTLKLGWDYEVVLLDTETVWREDVHPAVMKLMGRQPLHTRQRPLPDIQVVLGNRGWQVPRLIPDLEAACRHLLGELIDEVMMDTRGDPWPACPRNPPEWLAIEKRPDVLWWTCPSHGLIAPIGLLHRNPAAV